MESCTSRLEINAQPGAINTKDDPFFVAGVSATMRAMERAVGDIAITDIPVLIEGESGTGKGAMALHIHQLSRRKPDEFLKLNCAALTPEFLDEHIREAAQDRGNAWPGVGTLFLDEIGELDAVCQRKLLSTLPDGQNSPANGYSHVRVVASTAHNLENEVRAGRLREDLYYRVNGVCLRLPPLRQRREDIPALVDGFLTKYAAAFARPKPEVSRTIMRTFLEYAWPGNIRELEHCVQKIIALGNEQVALNDLRPICDSRANGEEGLSLKQAARAASRQAERELILKVLSRTRWNRKRAAQELRISYKALLYKMKQIGFDSAGS